MENEQKVPFHFLNSESELNVVNLGDVIDIASASRVHKNEWTLEGVRFFRSSDVTSNFFGKDNKPAFISFDLYKSLIKKTGIVKKGDILVTGGGTIGIPYLIDNDRPLYFKDADLLWLKSHNVIDGYYLYSYFSSPSLQKYLTSISHVGTISHYTIEQAKATPIKLPTFDEQKKIGLFFKNLDELIALHQQELDAFKQAKQGFLQKMFPSKGQSVPEIRFKEFKDMWSYCKLNEISEKVKEKNVDNAYSETLTNSAEFGIINQRDFFDKDISNKLNLYTYYVVQPDDFVYNPRISKLAPVGPIKRNKLGRAGVMSPLYYVFRIRNLDLTYLEYYFSTEKWHMFMKLNGDSGARSDRISIKDSIFSEMPIPLPSIEEQFKIGEFFKRLDEMIDLKEQELEALKQTKKGFLQKMFV